MDRHSEARQIVEQALASALREQGLPLPENWLLLTLAEILHPLASISRFLALLSSVLEQHGIPGSFDPAAVDFFLNSPQKTGAWVGEIFQLLENRDIPRDGAAPSSGPPPFVPPSSPPVPGPSRTYPGAFAPQPPFLAAQPVPQVENDAFALPGSARPSRPATTSEQLDELWSPVQSEIRRSGDAPNASIVRVFYATDRMENAAGLPPSARYDHQRSPQGELHYGQCEISIPKTHKTGKLESPSILRFEFRPDPAKHIILNQTFSLPEEVFFTSVNYSVRNSSQRDAFVFIHGYNVSFEDAARRTGQIAYDLQFHGAPIFYSWPSHGRMADYLRDETNITWSAPHFERFLYTLAQRSGAARIHIIAHSMGNRAVCDALKSLSRDPAASLKFTHLLLAAPDIDAQTFAELASTLQRLSARVTLYESSNDKAIQASKRLHGNPRAGEPLLILPGLDTIDASAIDTDFLGHSYFSDNWPLLSDIHSIVSRDESPANRFGLAPMNHAGGRYYAFRR